MKELEAWFFDNELVLNTTKTCAMLFHSRNVLINQILCTTIQLYHIAQI